MSAMRIAPCKGCSNRTPVCHGDCMAYRSWAAERVAELAAIRRTKDNEQAVETFLVNQGKRKRLGNQSKNGRDRRRGIK